MEAIAEMESLVSLRRFPRFGEYRTALEEAAQLKERFLVNWERDERKWRVFSEALVQCRQLVESRPLWPTFDRIALVGALRKIRMGEVLPPVNDEADEPRNTLLELATSARLSDCGFTPQITLNGADIVVHHAKFHGFVVECKRPMSVATLRSNLSRGRTQIRSRLAQHRMQRGMIVVGLDRMLGLTSSRNVIFRTEQALYSALQDVLDSLRSRLEEMIIRDGEVFFPDVPLITFVLSAAAFTIEDGKLHTPSYFNVMLSVPDEHPGAEPYIEFLNGLGFDDR